MLQAYRSAGQSAQSLTNHLATGTSRRCLSLSLLPPLSLYASICLCVFLSICLSVCLSFCLSVFLPVCLSVFLPVCLSISLSLYLSIDLSVYQSINQSIYLSTYLSIYLSVYLCTYPPVYCRDGGPYGKSLTSKIFNFLRHCIKKWCLRHLIQTPNTNKKKLSNLSTSNTPLANANFSSIRNSLSNCSISSKDRCTLFLSRCGLSWTYES